MSYLKKFEDELRLRNYAENSIQCYVNIAKNFISEFRKELAEITEEEIKTWLSGSSSQALLKQRIGSMKRFYQFVVKDKLKFRHIDYPRPEEHLPDVLSQNEMSRLISACLNLKHKAILLLFYSTGMREAELINLKITDIDSDRMVIRIEQGKGKKDRYVPLSEKTLHALRKYYLKERPRGFLFNGQFSDRYSATSIRNIVKNCAQKAGISKRVYPHLLRHCNATHLIETGTDVSIIQNMLGHKQQKTTMRYARISNLLISKVLTPDCFL